jgi:hypothetical protein
MHGETVKQVMKQLMCNAVLMRAGGITVNMEAQQCILCVLLVHDRDNIKQCIPFTLLRYMSVSAALYGDLSRR